MLAEVRAMPPGRDRDELLQELAAAYGQGDPQATLAWLESMSAASSSYRLNALQNVAVADPTRLLEHLEGLPTRADPGMIMSSILSGAPADKIADVLLTWDDSRSTIVLGSLLSRWLPEDPDAAVDWAIANSGKFNTRMLGVIAQNFASRDASAAVAQVDRLPADLRDDWISAIMIPYLRSDPRAALDWLARYRGQAVYEPTLRQIAMVAADRDPRALAQLVSQASAGLQLDAAPAVASALSTLDEAEAARWAESLSDARARQQAILTLVPTLARRNSAQAQRLVEAYITDPVERQRALAIIERVAGR
jgi:hypothetical protein